ncbi:unnamed protein product [Brachionus calyciflorus]|uniref:Uncharacterized protein n=1 Tax=Brachionus calyciflorus TaxID=104777 RepID=A0A813REJ2_9BILA|nr:unnamed protein product [Brachionus calyciflorus]
METGLDLSQLTKEVLVSSDIFGQFWNICIWDYNTGTNLHTYKNTNTISHGLAFIRDDYMLCAIHNKPYIMYWNLKGKSQQNKINTPGFINCLTVSNCGNYIAFGVEEKVFIYQSHSGKLVSMLTRHLQNLTCIKFSSNDNFLITASEDTTILVWDFHEVLTIEKEYLKPVQTWNNHSMRINDLFISPTSDRVVSASADQTCKFWNLDSDKPFSMDTVLFKTAPSRCILDNMETNLYVGLTNGLILRIPIKSIVNETNKMIDEDSNEMSFIGHKQKINCLSISLDDFTLASGSEDSSIRIWDTISRQCIKIVKHNGPVTNLEFKPRTFFFNDESFISAPLFSRYSNEKSNDNSISVVKNKQIYGLGLEDFLGNSSSKDICQEEYFELKCKYDNTKKINEKIYNYAVEKILNSS